ncbi:uncharacterized protein [Lolium perenne]|uniref:uncharacterized protein n=1 Tax=Lolium perenne TaxID=4522 RepID=UPI003A98FD84
MGQRLLWLRYKTNNGRPSFPPPPAMEPPAWVTWKTLKVEREALQRSSTLMCGADGQHPTQPSPAMASNLQTAADAPHNTVGGRACRRDEQFNHRLICQHPTACECINKWGCVITLILAPFRSSSLVQLLDLAGPDRHSFCIYRDWESVTIHHYRWSNYTDISMKTACPGIF